MYLTDVCLTEKLYYFILSLPSTDGTHNLKSHIIYNNVILRSSQKGMVHCCRKGINSILAHICSDSGKFEKPHKKEKGKKKLSCDLIQRSNEYKSNCITATLSYIHCTKGDKHFTYVCQKKF